MSSANSPCGQKNRSKTLGLAAAAARRPNESCRVSCSAKALWPAAGGNSCASAAAAEKRAALPSGACNSVRNDDRGAAAAEAEVAAGCGRVAGSAEAEAAEEAAAAVALAFASSLNSCSSSI